MYIENIILKNYRNYIDADVDFHEKVNIIIGDNAQGKTNLIEGIYISSMGKSFRTNRDNEIINFNKDFSSLKVLAWKDREPLEIDFFIRKDGKKKIKKDGINLSKISQLADNILTVIFSPEDLKIVKEEPEKRRKFIDRELCQISPSYFDSLSNYKKLIYQRNTYLKENYINNTLLDVWDVQIAKYGNKIINHRRAFVEKISHFSRNIHKSITEDREILDLRYKPSIDSFEEKEIYEELKDNLDKDKKIRTTGKGPHKDDMQFFINGDDVRSFASQGQQRTAALSLKLAELNLIKEETGEEGILLLDDVMSELDLRRQEFLIKTLKDNQIFITATNLDETLIRAFPESKIIRIKRGTVYI